MITIIMLGPIKYLLFITTFCFCSFLRAAPDCDPWIAKVASLNGRVEIQLAQQSHWLPITETTVFCPGDKVRTLRHSRVTLEFSNKSLVALEHSSTMIFPAPTNDHSFSWLIKLFKGSAFFRSRRVHQLDIHTPFVNAVHEGTEFLVAVKENHTEISVFDGQVAAENKSGRTLVKKGFISISKKDQPTQVRALTIKPEDAVQWALYYPPIVDYQSLITPSTAPEIHQVLDQFHQGKVIQALSILDGIAKQQHDENYIALKASMLLSVGSVDDALQLLNQAQHNSSTQSTALALKAIIAVSKNNAVEAIQLALKAIELNTESALAKIALSYAYQAQSKIDKALASTELASQNFPNDALIWARLAELQLASGDHKKALKSAQHAQRLNPQLARTQTVLGFVYLAQIEVASAQSAFTRAIKLNSADPLSRLGLGLTKIRNGLLNEGTRELETAVSLDPDNAIMRSYLGKAYYELKNEKYAATELAIAKEMDPKDPTPWFYDAILKQTDNRPIEALHDMQKAIELNDNRGVYRSKLLLDEDLAARSASLGRIYNDLGFQQLGLVEGWKSVTADPTNYSAHRLLADNYAALPRHEIARVSALLQSQLLQPVNITPVQPRLAESDKLASSTLGNASFNEYNALFLRNQFNVQGTGIAGNNDSFGEETVYSGIWNKLSYSFGQYHFQSQGFRENNDIKQFIYNAFVQYQATSDLNIQFEYRYNDLENGDLSQQFDARLFTDSLRENFRRQLYRIGANYHPDPSTHILFSGIYTKDDFSSDLEVEFDTIIPVNSKNNSDTYSFELQYIKDFQWAKIILGGSHIHNNQSQNVLITDNINIPADGFFTLTDIDVTFQINNHTDFDSDHSNAYLYTFLNYEDITGILGVSYDNVNSHIIPDVQRFNPKLGMLWKASESTTVRAAYFQGVKKPFAANQTIEPVQIAGFVQFFDGDPGTEYEQFGLGLDHKFNNSTYFGLEGTYRRLEVPFIYSTDLTIPFPDETTPRVVRINETSELVEFQEQNEYHFRSYFNWTPTQRISASIEYQLSIYDRVIDNDLPNPDLLNDVVTHQVPISISYFDPNGLYSKLRTTFVHQQTRSDEPTNTGNEHFWSVDALVGYKFPKRFGRLEFGVRNLLDENYQFAFADRILSERSRPSRANFIPERTFFTQLIFDFDL